MIPPGLLVCPSYLARCPKDAPLALNDRRQYSTKFQLSTLRQQQTNSGNPYHPSGRYVYPQRSKFDAPDWLTLGKQTFPVNYRFNEPYSHLPYYLQATHLQRLTCSARNKPCRQKLWQNLPPQRFASTQLIDPEAGVTKQGRPMYFKKTFI
jgi:hypothetical protein